MVVNDRPLKRFKRRIIIKDDDLFHYYDFLNFPVNNNGGIKDPFRLNVINFLSKHATRLPFLVPSLFPSLVTWQIPFRSGDGDRGVFALDIVEEDVTRSTRSVYCDQCRVVGWSANPVCRKRYHFIIRANNNRIGGYHKTCSVCGNSMNLLESSCKSCNALITANEVDEWIYLHFEDATHLLHGVVHSNGYGHLLTVNGREGGSSMLSGCEIMNFWDRLCRSLSVRKVSVMDVSKKYGMEYRMLHAIMRGHSWYGAWGYEFGAGCYAVTLDSYKKAMDILRNTPLTLFFFQGRKPWSRLQTAIAYYQSISDSGLYTLNDLFSFLLRLIGDIYKNKVKSKKPRFNISTTTLCPWTRNDVEAIECSLIKILLATSGGDSRWVARHAIRGAMAMSVSPVLLDYCMKHLEGMLTANGMVVGSRWNPITQAVELRLHPQSLVDNMEAKHPLREQIIRDLYFFYESILNPETMVMYIPKTTRKVLSDSASKLIDCKQFVKDFKLEDDQSSSSSILGTKLYTVHLWCRVELIDETKGDPITPPPELLIFPANATFGDLKSEATKVFQEVYALFKRFQADELQNYGQIDDSMTLQFLFGLTGSVCIRGRCQGKRNSLNRFRMERGMENWTVDCICGAKDDDGEKMFACDTCGIWQHTRCAGIDNTTDDAKFLCMRCVNKYHPLSVLADEIPQLGATCIGESVAASNGPGIRSSLALTFGVG